MTKPKPQHRSKLIPARPKRTAEELKEVSAHIHYEFAMCILVADALRLGGSSLLVKNALINSLTIHTRALIHFFFPKNPHPDDVLAEDYYQSPEDWERARGVLPAELADVHVRVGKEIAHLTYARLLVTPDKKGWHHQKIKAAVLNLGERFANSVDHPLLHPKWFKTGPTTL